MQEEAFSSKENDTRRASLPIEKPPFVFGNPKPVNVHGLCPPPSATSSSEVSVIPGTFRSLDEAKRNITEFARAAGFDICIGRSRFRKDHTARSIEIGCNFANKDIPKLPNGKSNYSCPFALVLKQHPKGFVEGEKDQLVHVIVRRLDHTHPMLSVERRTALSLIKDADTTDMMTKLKQRGFSSPQVRPEKEEAIGLISTRQINQMSSPTPMQRECDSHELLQLLAESKQRDPQFYYNADIDPITKRLRSIFWITSQQRSSYRAFHDVVSMDTKYRSNRYSKPFALIVTESSHGTTLILCQAVLVDEKSETFQWLFRSLLDAVEVAPETIFTDGDPAMAAAIADTLPTTHQRLCQWHLHKNLLKNLSWLGPRLKDFMKRWTKLMNEDDVLCTDNFDVEWLALLGDFELNTSGERRFITDLYNSRDKWAHRFVNSTFHGHLNSTQRSESMNARFQALLSPQSSMVSLFNEVNRYSGTRIRDFIRRVEKDRVPAGKRIYEKDLGNRLTSFGVGEVMTQCDEALQYFCEVGQNEENLVVTRRGSEGPGRIVRLDPEHSCPCRRTVWVGLPCRHLIAAMMSKRKDTSLPSSMFNARWLKAEAIQLRDSIASVDISIARST